MMPEVEERPEPASGRLFVAIDMPNHVVQSVQRLRADAGKVRGLNWIAPEKLHLTLAFLGEVEPLRQWQLFDRLPESRIAPFFLTIEGLGVFPRKGIPKILWAGLAPADPRLFQLHTKVERILLDLGFEPTRRRYHPHLTVARCGAEGGSAALAIVKKHRDFGTAPFKVNKFCLYASQLTSRGAQYTRLLEIPFENS